MTLRSFNVDLCLMRNGSRQIRIKAASVRTCGQPCARPLRRLACTPSASHGCASCSPQPPPHAPWLLLQLHRSTVGCSWRMRGVIVSTMRVPACYNWTGRLVHSCESGSMQSHSGRCSKSACPAHQKQQLLECPAVLHEGLQSP